MSFQTRYGEWAVVAGASEGLGATYARQLAARGLYLVLVARRPELLQPLASELCQTYNIQAKILEIDLADDSAADRLLAETVGVQVGLLVYNAAFSAVGPFLSRPLDDHLREINTNTLTPLKLVHLFGGQMLERGRGGILLMSSLSGFQGSAYISTYAATKAFNIVLAEGLWEEWRGKGVDVLACISGAIRTPNYLASEPEKTGGPGDLALAPEQVVSEALDALGRVPYVIPGKMNRAASFVMRHLLPRHVAIKFMGRTLGKMYGEETS